MKVELGQYKDLGFDKPNVDVADNELVQAKQHLIESLGKWIDSNNVSKLSDKIIIDYIATHDGEYIPEGKDSDVDFVIGEGRFPDYIENSLIGLEKDKTHKMDITLPDNYPYERLRGKEVLYEVTIKSIQELVYPQNDEEIIEWLAIDEIKSNDDLLKELKKEISAHKLEVTSKELLEKIVKKIINDSNVTFDDNLLDEQALKMYDNFMEILEKEDMPIEVYYAYENTTPDKFKVKFIESAKEEIILNSVLDQIAKIETISIENDEFMAKKYKYMYEKQINEKEFSTIKDEFLDNQIRLKAIQFLAKVNTK